MKLALTMALEQVQLSGVPDTDWQALSSTIRETAINILGQARPGTRKVDKEVWFWNERVQTAVRSKKTACKRWKATGAQADREAYCLANKVAKRTVAIAKTEHYRTLFDGLDSRKGQNGIYRLAKKMSNNEKDLQHIKQVKHENGHTLSRPSDICDRWRRHFERVCTTEFEHQPIPIYPPIAGPVPPLSPDEIGAALRNTSGNKSNGPDDVSAVAWKLADDVGIDRLTNLLNSAHLSRCACHPNG